MMTDCSPEKVAERIIDEFKRIHTRKDPFQVLICTILSQRTRDENTDTACENLFTIYDSPEKLARASTERVEELIKPSGMFRQKARRIMEVARIILEEYGGKVPDEMEKLLKLPGVGRKTANIVLSIAFNKQVIAVDTHVHRISNRLGWVQTKTPYETEKELYKIIPRNLWKDLNGAMVEFGRQICKPINPRCRECPVHRCCDYFSSPAIERRKT